MLHACAQWRLARWATCYDSCVSVSGSYLLCAQRFVKLSRYRRRDYQWVIILLGLQKDRWGPGRYPSRMPGNLDAARFGAVGNLNRQTTRFSRLPLRLGEDERTVVGFESPVTQRQIPSLMIANITRSDSSRCPSVSAGSTGRKDTSDRAALQLTGRFQR
jgi:hypothetical protein